MSQNTDKVTLNCTPPADLVTWCEELNQVRGNVSQLQATLNHILNKAPTVLEYRGAVQQFDDDLSQLGSSSAPSSSSSNNLSQFKSPVSSSNASPAIIERTKSILNSSQLKIAVRLKYLYSRGYLPLLLALANINFRSLKQDRFVGYFLNYIPPHVVKRDIPDALKKVLSDEKSSENGISLSVEDENYPPFLPLISDGTILNQVLTDKSYVEPQVYLETILSQLRDGTASNGPEWSRPVNNLKLALMGQLLLETCLIEIIDHQYPLYDEEDIYVLVRQHLTTPLMLLRFVIGYNLAGHLNYLMSRLDTVDDKLRVFHRLFCAYIGGLRKDGYTYKDLLVWLRRLYLPLVSTAGYSPKKHAMADLEFLFRQANNFYAGPVSEMVDISYEIEEKGELGIIEATVKVDQDSLGVGTHSSDPEVAKERAAAYALSENRDLVILKVALMLQRGIQKQQAQQQTAETHTKQPVQEVQDIQTNVVSQNMNDFAGRSSDDESYSPVMSPASNNMDKHDGENDDDDDDDDYDPEQTSQPFQHIETGNRHIAMEEPTEVGPLPYGMVPGRGGEIGHESEEGNPVLRNTFESMLASRQLVPRYESKQLKKGILATVFVGNVEMGRGRGKTKSQAVDLALSSALKNGTAWRLLGF